MFASVPGVISAQLKRKQHFKMNHNKAPTDMKAHQADNPCSPLAAPRLMLSRSSCIDCQNPCLPKDPTDSTDTDSKKSLPQIQESSHTQESRENAAMPEGAHHSDASLHYFMSESEEFNLSSQIEIREDQTEAEEPPREILVKNDSQLNSLELQESIARRLQEEYDQEYLAHRLQEELEREERAHREHLNGEHERKMVASHTGRAWKFVEKVFRLHRTKNYLTGVDPVAVDDMVFLAENMLRAQNEFRMKGLPWKVDIGYHYTKEENMARIKTDGLLSRAERHENQIKSSFNGEAYGPGIYTGNDCESFCSYGKVGLIVARLKGLELDPKKSKKGYDLGNTSISSGALVVLQKAYQCLALIQFPRNKRHEAVQEYTSGLQSLLQEFFNNESPIPVPLSAGPLSHQVTGTEEFSTKQPPLSQIRPKCVHSYHNSLRSEPSNLYQYEPPTELYEAELPSSLYETCSVPHSSGCSICLCDFNPPHETIVKLYKCGHEFHRDCIDKSLAESRQCPLCNVRLAKLQGTMPSGEMATQRDRQVSCAGYESVGTIIVSYSIPRGIQQAYHYHPGEPHGSFFRTTCVPDTKEGRALVARLRYAFLRGLTFSIGTSLTTGEENCVLWSSIPHKTSTHEGPCGFPDDRYFERCNDELDKLGVPRPKSRTRHPRRSTDA